MISHFQNCVFSNTSFFSINRRTTRQDITSYFRFEMSFPFVRLTSEFIIVTEKQSLFTLSLHFSNLTKKYGNKSCELRENCQIIASHKFYVVIKRNIHNIFL